MIWLLAGCLTMDGFFFNPTRVDAYELGGDVIPAPQVEEVAFPSADGTTLAGVWAHQSVPGSQTFVYFHGNADNIDAYWDRVGIYWELGYEVFVFDYQGYGKSEGSPSYDAVLADGIGAVDYVTTTTGETASQLVYHGLSLGGAVAVHTAVDRPPRVLITEDMFASAKKLADDGTGLDMPAGWFLEDAWDNVAAARQVFRPYLVMHAAEDTYVQPSNGELVYSFTNPPSKLWLVPGADHDESPEAAPEDYRAQIDCWIQQTCPGE